MLRHKCIFSKICPSKFRETQKLKVDRRSGVRDRQTPRSLPAPPCTLAHPSSPSSSLSLPVQENIKEKSDIPHLIGPQFTCFLYSIFEPKVDFSFLADFILDPQQGNRLLPEDFVLQTNICLPAYSALFP
jgi:hypothetical protein